MRCDDGAEKESNDSSRAKSVGLFIYFEVEVICTGLPQDEVEWAPGMSGDNMWE